MSSITSFNAISQTFALVVTATSKPIQPLLPVALNVSAKEKEVMGLVDYRITNIGTEAVWVAHTHAADTSPTAAIPADGASARGLMIPPNSTVTVYEPVETKFAAIAAATGSTIYITIGSGIAWS
jgi:hypothetical protein